MSLLGVDVGTTGVKAVAFAADGRQLALAYEEYPLLHPFVGAAELDPTRVAAAALRVIAEAAHGAGSDLPAAIGVASQGEAFAPIGADGEFLTNIMTSSDSRAVAIIPEIEATFGRRPLFERTGHTSHPMHSLFKFVWLRRNRPEVSAAARMHLFAQDIVVSALTGASVTDHSMAARSMLYDVQRLRWDPDLLALAGLRPDHLPGVVQAGTAVGTVRPHVARATGLSASTVVTPAGHDQPVGALGCGAAATGAAGYSIGTVECITPTVDRFAADQRLIDANLAIYPHVLPGRYTTVAYNITGGSALRWLRDQLLPDLAAEAVRDGVDPYDRLVAAAGDSISPLLLMPHFGPTGTPHYDPHGIGALIGLDQTSTRADIIGAFLEGITYEMRWNLEALRQAGFELNELRAIGGGSRSAPWMQTKADILGVPLTTMQVSEATCMGAALLAGSALGALDPDDAAGRWATRRHTYEPRADRAAAHADRFGIYQDLYRTLGVVRQRMHALKGT